MSVVVFGSANADLTVSSRRFPEPGETLTGTSFTTGLGGKGLNQAVAAARLGAPTAFVGRVGSDDFGHQLRSGLAHDQVDVSDLSADAARPSGVAIIFLGAEGQNSIVVVPGANGAVGRVELERLDRRLQSATVLLLQLELPMAAVLAAIEMAGHREVTVLLDPAPAVNLPSTAYASHVILTPNEVEAAMLVGFDLVDDDAVLRAARTLLGRGAGGVVIKLGARGLVWATAGRWGREPALPVVVRDTVGAGDAVNGALAAALGRGAPLTEAVREAAAAGGLAVTRPGGYAAMPTREELLSVLVGTGAGPVRVDPVEVDPAVTAR